MVEHPSLDEIRLGFMGEMKKRGFHNVRYHYLNAQGDMVTSSQIASKLIGAKPDVIIAITTPSTQHLLAKKSDIPIVFSGVDDPVGARLITKLAKPGGRVTGVMLLNPVEEQMQLIKKVRPNVKKVGFIYSAGEDNSLHNKKLFLTATKKLKWGAEIVSVNNTSQVMAAAQSLVGKVDAIYLPTDNTVISALAAVLQLGKQAHIPVIAADVASAKKGAVAALGVDHFEIGAMTAQQTIRILKGAKAGDLDVLSSNTFSLYINLRHASDKMGLSFPVSVLKKAEKIYR